MKARSGIVPTMSLFVGLLGSASWARADDAAGKPLPGTEPLTMTGDIADELVAGVDRFLLRKIDESTAERARHWKRDFSIGRGLQRLGRAQPQAAGTHPGRAGSAGAARRPAALRSRGSGPSRYRLRRHSVQHLLRSLAGLRRRDRRGPGDW